MHSNKKELEDNPRYALIYKKAAGKYLENNAKKRNGNKTDEDTYYNWWINFCGGK
jgi:hypothetical protein